ncbi:disease resistance protein RGA3 [Populus alba x Populus x berolinensis]|nr:disease resistance protein RGA3 [Populus alba x Populus x berolinensis]
MNVVLPKLIANLSCLRTLNLSSCGIEEVPSNIRKLIHLRYVDLSRNEIRELPKEMCELYNMLTLDVSYCSELERLPDNIGRLVKLRHLSILNIQFMKKRGVEGLSSLRQLDVFHVSGSGEESNIGDLRNLNHLQGSLRMRWLGDVKDPDEVKKAELHNKKHLTHLELCEEGEDSDISTGEMTSSSSSNTIIAFPKLKNLSFGYMEEWEEWEGGEGGNEDKTNISISTIMPSLRSLEIRHCPKLKALPDYVLQSTTLEKLEIKWSPIIEEQFKAGGKGWPNASHTPNITF